MPPITVLIADRDEAKRAACARVLLPENGIQVVGRAQNELETLSATAKLKPRILLLGLDLLQKKKILLLCALRQKSPRTKVILLTRHTPETRILEAFSYGARDFLEEKGLGAFLAKAVRCVDAGEAWVPRKMVARIIERLAHLTACE
jgi:DNA-binding NarL/FixJ family response regulator